MEYANDAKDTMARAKMTNVVASPKDSREVSAALRGKSVAAGLALLADVKEKKRPIRFTRYNNEGAGHRRGTGPGRYPLKAAMAFEDLLESVRANAEFKDLDPELLRIVHIKADIAARPFRYGRHRGRQGKRTNIEVIVEEDERLKAKKTTKKQSVSETKQKATSQKAAVASEADASKPSAEKTETKASTKTETKAAPKEASKESAAPKSDAQKSTAQKDDSTKKAAASTDVVSEKKEPAKAAAAEKTESASEKKAAPEKKDAPASEKKADAPADEKTTKKGDNQ